MLQLTESWRTGRRLDGERHAREVAANPPIRRDGEGAYAFRRRVNSYYQRLSANMQSQPSYRGHALTSDDGHYFRTLRVLPSFGQGETFSLKTNRVLGRGVTAPHFLLLDPDARWWANNVKYSEYASVLSPASVSASQSSAHLKALKIEVQGSFNNMIPDNQLFGWGETVIELLKGNFPKAIPDLIKRAQRGAKLDPKATGKSLGSDYLNARFGIEPIVKDFISTVLHLSSVHELMYDNYKRFRATQLVSHTDRTTSMQYVAREGSTGGNVPGDEFTRYIASSSHIHAKFTKAQPTRGALTGYDRAQQVIRDIGFNEKLTWDLLPWSWLIDWSGSIGRSIENATAFNTGSGRFVMNYAWVTRRTTFFARGPKAVHFYRSAGEDRVRRTTGGSTSAVLLERTQQSPFGLDFTLPEMSAYQWSILVSLGLARLK